MSEREPRESSRLPNRELTTDEALEIESDRWRRVVAAFLLGFFFLPLPVTRVRQPGVVQVQPDYLEPVHIKTPGILQRVYVTEGQTVTKGKILADPIITHHFRLDQIHDAFHTYTERLGNALKVVIHV